MKYNVGEFVTIKPEYLGKPCGGGGFFRDAWTDNYEIVHYSVEKEVYSIKIPNYGSWWCKEHELNPAGIKVKEVEVPKIDFVQTPFDYWFDKELPLKEKIYVNIEKAACVGKLSPNNIYLVRNISIVDGVVVLSYNRKVSLTSVMVVGPFDTKYKLVPDNIEAVRSGSAHLLGKVVTKKDVPDFIWKLCLPLKEIKKVEERKYDEAYYRETFPQVFTDLVREVFEVTFKSPINKDSFVLSSPTGDIKVTSNGRGVTFNGV